MCKFKIILTVLLGLLISSFSLSPAQAQDVDAIVTPDEAELEVGESLQFEVFAFSISGVARVPVEITDIEWTVESGSPEDISSTNLNSVIDPDSLGTITRDGFFIAGRHQGVVIIRVVIQIGQKRILKKISIRIGRQTTQFFRVKVVPHNAVVPQGAEQQFKVVVNRADHEIPAKFVRWEVKPDDLGKIDDDGLFTAGNDKRYGKVIAHVEADGLHFRASADVVVSPPASGAIAGKVLSDSDSSAIKGAVVKAVRLGRVRWIQKTETDDHGEYLLGDLIPGVYVVKANARSFLMEFYDDTRSYLEATPINVAEDDTTFDVDFALSEGGEITGTVIADNDSTPLARAHVAAVLVVNNRFARHTLTGANGAYTIEPLPDGDYYVVATAPGYKGEYYDDVKEKAQATFVHVDEPQTRDGIDFGLETASAIQGLVTNERDGSPIAGAYVLVYGHPNVSAVTRRILRETRTNENGEYLLQIRPGTYILQASAKGFNGEFYDNKINRSDANRVVVAPDSHTTDINFDLSPRSTISGNVSEQGSGLPIAGAVVEAFKERVNLDASVTNAGFRARTDSLGNFEIEDVAAGKYILLAWTEGYLPEFYNEKEHKRDADLIKVSTDTAISNIDFTLEKGGSISGFVATEADSTPIPKALVRVFAKNSDRHIKTYTNEHGEYKVGGLPTGSYYVQVVALNFFTEFYDNARHRGDAKLVDVTAPDETTGIDFYLVKHRDKRGTIAGRVVSTSDAAPLHGAIIIAVSPGKRIPHFAFTGPNGFYRITDLPAGRYFVFAWSPGFIGEFFKNAKLFRNADPVVVNQNTPTPGIDFGLDPVRRRGLYTIRGRIRVHDGNNPIHGILVHAKLDNDVEVNAVTDANGDFILSGLPAGDYALEATGAGYADANTSTAISVGNGDDAENVNLVMQLDNTTDVANDGTVNLPELFSLDQNYPNPFNPETTIKYQLADKANVTLKIFNMLGQQVKTLVDKVQVTGSYAVVWDGKDNLGHQVASGIYILQIKAGDQFRMSRRMMLLK